MAIDPSVLSAQREKAKARKHQGQRRSIYLSEALVADMKAESARQERPLSWLIRFAWRVALPRIRAMPSVREER